MVLSLSFEPGDKNFESSQAALSSSQNANEKALIAGLGYYSNDDKQSKTTIFLLKHTTANELTYQQRVTLVEDALISVSISTDHATGYAVTMKFGKMRMFRFNFSSSNCDFKEAQAVQYTLVSASVQFIEATGSSADFMLSGRLKYPDYKYNTGFVTSSKQSQRRTQLLPDAFTTYSGSLSWSSSAVATLVNLIDEERSFLIDSQLLPFTLRVFISV